jgi:hypothetical protein
VNVLAGLTACAGRWRGTNRLHDPNTNKPEDSTSTLAVTPVIGGRFFRLDYTWSHQGVPQEGSLLLGFERKAEKLTAHWIDSFHMGDSILSCVGQRSDRETFAVRGAYAVPPGPDWGWRIEITPDHPRGLHVVMINISPEGGEELAVEGSYTRAESRTSLGAMVQPEAPATL